MKMKMKMKIQEPKFIISKKQAFKQVEILKEVFDEVSYSFKTNPTIGQILMEKEVCDFSLTSQYEIEQFFEKIPEEKKGQISKRILYFAFALNKEILHEIFQKYNVENIVIENSNDLETLINYINKNNIKINLLLRMKLRENTIFTGKHYVFGMKVKEIQEHIDNLEDNKNINSIGIHFHRKTQNVSEWSLKQEVANSLGEKYLQKIDTLNLGGGLPSNYKNIHDKSLESIFTKIKELKNYIKEFNIKLVIEPGRFISAPCVKLESQIIAINENNLFLNVSIFNGMLDTNLANVKLHIEQEIEKGKRYLLKGCTPDSADILRYSVYLENPKIGDTITFLNCGAYTYTTNFCNLPKIKEEIIE